MVRVLRTPIERLSGDQNGWLAPSVPASGFASVWSSRRSQSRDGPSPDATYTMWRPSGDRANCSGASLAGVVISTRISGRRGLAQIAQRGHRHRDDHAATTAAATIQGSRPRDDAVASGSTA